MKVAPLVEHRVQAFSTERPCLPPTDREEQGPRYSLAKAVRGLWVQPYPESGTLDEKAARFIFLAQKRKRESRRRLFDKQLAFSWPRFFLGLLSLVLVCSDVPRSGLGIKEIPAVYPMLEPDVFLSFGPWYYSVQKLSKDAAKNATARIWSYNYDTTSIVLRAFAEFYQLTTFPDCIMYREACAGLTLNGEVVFNMLDSIVATVAMK